MCNSESSDAKAMPGLGERNLSPAILHYLGSAGVHVRPGKLSPSQEKAVSTPARRLFGVPLRSLPLSAQAEGVPHLLKLPIISFATRRFLVEACELLRLHLHTEGLFRKTGSLTRIEALKARLEAGESCLHMALPCDVATLVKQFLRGLLEPLVPAELQGPMCRVQQLQEEDRGPLTLLLTCLLPQASASTLRYFFGFLQDVAARCSQNKMDLANLAVIFAPSLFSSELCSKLDEEAGELLQTQATVIELLISRASEIGTVPQSLLGKVQAAFSDAECKRLSPPRPGGRRGGEVESRWKRRRQRRRSVGDIVTEALSKFKSGRALRAVPCPERKEGVCQGDESPNDATLRTSFNSKRKASDEVAGSSEFSAKKRRSALGPGGSDSSNEEVFLQPMDAGPVPAPASPILVFSSSPSNPVSGVGSHPGSPRISPTKAQRRRSSCKKRLQRKHSTHAAPSCSPKLFERKDVGRKSLRIFFQVGKDPPRLSLSIKATEPKGQLLTKKKVTEAPEGPGSHQQQAPVPSHQPKETEVGSPGQSSDEDSPPCINPQATETAVKCKNGSDASPSLDGVSHKLQELTLNRSTLGKSEGLLGSHPLRQLRVLRRSLSWPEDLSVRETAGRGETDSFPNEAAIEPGDRSGLAEPEQPAAEVIVASVRQAGNPAVCVTLDDGYGAACPENGSHDIPNSLPSSEPGVPDSHSARADGFRKVPQSILKRLTLNFQQQPSLPNAARLKRKGGRRFGRSLSHESGLPLRADEEAGGAAKKKGGASPCPKSPLRSFKAYGRQIFITHKYWAMAFVGLRGRKEPASPSPQETVQAAADSQDSFSGHQLEGERQRYHCSPKFPLAEPQLVAGQDFLDL